MDYNFLYYIFQLLGKWSLNMSLKFDSETIFISKIYSGG